MLKSTWTVSLLTTVANRDLPPGPTKVPISTLLSLMYPEMGDRTEVYPKAISAWVKLASLICTSAIALS